LNNLKNLFHWLFLNNKFFILYFKTTRSIKKDASQSKSSSPPSHKNLIICSFSRQFSLSFPPIFCLNIMLCYLLLLLKEPENLKDFEQFPQLLKPFTCLLWLIPSLLKRGHYQRIMTSQNPSLLNKNYILYTDLRKYLSFMFLLKATIMLTLKCDFPQEVMFNLHTSQDRSC
jgi:hypothetical protein